MDVPNALYYHRPQENSTRGKKSHKRSKTSIFWRKRGLRGILGFPSWDEKTKRQPGRLMMVVPIVPETHKWYNILRT